MSKLYTFEMKQGQKLKSAAKKAVALAQKRNAPILFKFDKFTQLLLTPLMDIQDIFAMYNHTNKAKILQNNQKGR